jgi:hypothetical protein
VLGDHLPVGPHKPADSDVWESQPDCFFYGCASLQRGTRRSRDHQNHDSVGLETPTPKHVQGSALSIHHSHPIALTGPLRCQLPLDITTMRLGLGSVLAPVSAKLAGISAVSTEAGRISSALAPAPRLCRAHTSASLLPDPKNTGIIRLGRTSVAVSPHNVPHHPPTSQPSGLIVQVRSTQRRRRRMETREISLGSLEHTVQITACVFKIPLVQ